MANLANLPEEVILYSEGLLKKLEDNKDNKKNLTTLIENDQMELFNFENVKEKKKQNNLMDKIKFINIDKLTPLEAINILSDLQRDIKDSNN